MKTDDWLCVSRCVSVSDVLCLKLRVCRCASVVPALIWADRLKGNTDSGVAAGRQEPASGGCERLGWLLLYIPQRRSSVPFICWSVRARTLLKESERKQEIVHIFGMIWAEQRRDVKGRGGGPCPPCTFHGATTECWRPWFMRNEDFYQNTTISIR